MDGRATSRSPAAAIAPLVRGLVDFAGTFPPAGLRLAEAAEQFVSHLAGRHRAVLARMAVALDDLVPLDAWCRAHAPHFPLPVAAIVGERWAEGAAAARRLSQHVLVEALEGRASSVADAAAIQRAADMGAVCYVEVPLESPAVWPALLDALKLHGLRAKLRTGALVPSAIPAPQRVAEFLVSTAARRLPCKLTAGLHHALSCERALTYAADSPRGAMYGFVNAYTAAALAYLRAAPSERVAACLVDENRANFRATPIGLTWCDETFTSVELATLRESVGAFGSCSFDEPVHDLVELGWLDS